MSDCVVLESPAQIDASEAARALQRRSVESRRQNQQSQTTAEPTEPEPVAPNPTQFDVYTSERLADVKEEIVRTQALQRKATDSADVDRFSRALQRLVDVYCKLAGIPDPGSYRPAKPRGRQAAERITPE